MHRAAIVPGRYLPWLATGAACALFSVFGDHWSEISLALFMGLLFSLGCIDLIQTSHAVRRNYPLVGRLRYFLESYRAEIRQYFIESDDEKLPFSRNQRAMVYSRAKLENDKRGMGSLKDAYQVGAEWLAHSSRPVKAQPSAFRIRVGEGQCSQPYDMSVFNISGMSFGALSGAAVRALNKGAALGGFAQNTGEGSFSKHHEQGGDIIMQLGSGYFGCRDAEGHFSEAAFAARASHPQVKMIEVKLSQGAKPGHGGVLPGPKVSREIAAARGVAVGRDCVSPASHSAFTTPEELLAFVERLRQASRGKPVGIKLCVGEIDDWFALTAAMVRTGQHPDFITIDGSEGGTGAAPVEFADHVGMPMRDALVLVHNTLRGLGLRSLVRIGVAGKVISAFDIARAAALGADWCNAARGFMFAIGCIQSRSCHTDHCPTGVATQDPLRERALAVTDKSQRVANYHQATLKHLADLLGAAGVLHPRELTSRMIMIRGADGQARRLSDQIQEVPDGALLSAGARAGLSEPYRSFAL